MDYTTLGKTGLKVSVAGLGCGGNSRIGQGSGKSEDESVALVRRALDLGVNLLDTAANYKTEGIVGKAIKAVPRDSVVVTTKTAIRKGETLFDAAHVVESLDNSLRLLDTDYIDVFQPHGVPPWAYDHVMNEFVPALQREQEKGKFRFLGITETSPNDPVHEMLLRAVNDDCWSVMMFGFHMMHQRARKELFPKIIEHNIGTLQMFVVRNIFSQPDYLQNTMKTLAAEGKVPAEIAEKDNPLDFLVHEGGASSLTDAAYRFVRHQPGVSVVLFGTGSVDHLEANIDSILKPPLPAEDLQRLYDLFGDLDGVGLDLPDRHGR